MKTNTRQKILDYIEKNNPISINDIKEEFWISTQMIHRHINKLLIEDKIYKIWESPKVFYFPNITVDISIVWFVGDSVDLKKSIGNDFFDIHKFAYFWPDWETKYWLDWFIIWCYKRNLDPIKEISIYENTIKKYENYKTNYWLINWIGKMKDTFDEVYLDEIYYIDFYSIEKYWKTYLWNLMFYAKQTWDKELAEIIIKDIKPIIYNLIDSKNIDSFAFIPPSIDRKIQLMDEINKWLWIKLPELKLIKLFRDKVVAQKSLSKTSDRIENARDTIFVLDKKFKSDTILLIDDAVWSWSTLNETAKKIKERWIAKKVIWLAIVWSYKWFEVINEV